MREMKKVLNCVRAGFACHLNIRQSSPLPDCEISRIEHFLDNSN